MRSARRGAAVAGGALSLALAALLGCAHPPAVTGDPRPAEPLAFGADLHVHVTMARGLPIFSGEPGSGILASSPAQMLVNQVDADGLRRAGVRVVVAALWPSLSTRPGRSKRGEALHQLLELRRFVARRPDFAIAGNTSEIGPIVARGQVALVPVLEGGEGIASVEDVDLLYVAGARGVQLVHFTDNALADAEDAQFGTAVGLLLDGRDGGLTGLGRAVVKRMLRLGMVVDLAHASERTIEEVLPLAEEEGAPVLYSHAGAVMQRPFGLADAQAVRLARAGGLIGIGVYRSDFLVPTPEESRWSGHQLATCDDVVVHWLHYAALTGPEAVMLGSDFSSMVVRPRQGGECPDGLRHTGDLPYLFAALARHGVPQARLNDAGERLVQLLRRVEALADPTAQAKARARKVSEEDLFDVPL
ncbi:MAG: dipeptidase [Myxococcaceae bacterium]